MSLLCNINMGFVCVEDRWRFSCIISGVMHVSLGGGGGVCKLQFRYDEENYGLCRKLLLHSRELKLLKLYKRKTIIRYFTKSNNLHKV